MPAVREPVEPGILSPSPGESRSINGLTRREVIALLSTITAGLAGCSSSASPTGPGGVTPPPPPPSPPPTGLGTVSGSVTLPSGSTLSLSSLSLKAMGQTMALTGATTVAVGVSPDAPTLAMVTDANGNGVLAGFLDGSVAGAQAITARSTGVVLSWFVLGGPFLPANAKSQVLALLNADPAMTTLGAVIAQRIAADPLAVVNGDAQIATAMNAALTSLSAGAGGGTGDAPGAHLQGNPPILLLSPAGNQGGVTVTQDGINVAVDIANAFQRPVMVYVYETETNTAGTVNDLVPAKLVAGPFALGEPTSMTAVGGIASLLGLTVPFSPVAINPIPLALAGASDSTTYEVVIIGPSATGVIPAFFSAPRYAAEVAGWNDQITQLFYRTWYVDLVYAYLLELTGYASLLPTSPSLVAAGATTQKFSALPFSGGGGVAMLPPTLPQMFVKTQALMASLVSGPGLGAQFKSTMPAIVSSVSAQVLNAVNTVDWQASLATGTNFVNKLASPFSGYTPNRSVSKLFDNLANADRGLLWTAEVAKAQVSITPASATLSQGDMIALTVVLSPDLVSTYEFDWSSTSISATLSAVGEVNQGLAITTQKFTVDLQTTSADLAPIVVTVAVYDLASGHRTLVNRASMTVTMLQKATLTPDSVILAVGGQQTFNVAVSGTLPPGVQYLWSVVGGSGTIGTVNVVTTTVPSISYTALVKGTDTLSVQVVDSTDHLVARTSVVINVDPDGFIQFTIAGLWNVFGNGPPNGSYTFAFGDGVRVPNVAPGVDGVLLTYGLVGPNQSVWMSLGVPAGQPVNTGEVFSKFVAGSQQAGQFQISLAMDFHHLDNTGDVPPDGTGVLTLDNVSQLSDGTFVVQYSFHIANSTGGTMVGNGAGLWK